jgi:uncharacterized membrane protein
MAIWKQPTTYILCFLLCVGAFLRFDQISRTNLWVDEYCTLYLSTGRGTQIFDIPLNKVIRSPPAANFTDAPHWWHIWTGMAPICHPPLYPLFLRAWVDLFGDGDLATRGMSAAFGLAGIVLIFEVGKALHGRLLGIFAAGMMTFSAAQIDFDQQTRPYAMLAFIGLFLWRSLIVIEQKGVSRIRLTALALGVTGLALTHYFSLGVIAAAALYAGLRLRGGNRRSMLSVMAGSLLFFAVIWGPLAWKNRHQYIAGPDFGKTGAALGAAVIDVPRKLVFWELGDPVGKTMTGCALAFLVYLSPMFRIGRDPKLLAPWLWVIGGVGFVVAVDFLGHTQFVDTPRYTFLCSPACYLILASPWGKGIGRLLPPVLLLATILFGIDRWQSGPQAVENSATLGRLIEEKVGEHDAVIITGQFPSEPALRYFAVSHYAGDWRRPVIFLTQPPDRTADQDLSTFHRIWVVGHDPSEMDSLLPGWRATEFHGVRPGLCFWAIQRAIKS